MQKIMTDPDMQQKAANIGLIPITPPSVAETSAYITSEQAKWGALVEKLGLKGTQ
jgi:tripartite-type tricarboxylate transporter receptor subunit TctC